MNRKQFFQRIIIAGIILIPFLGCMNKKQEKPKETKESSTVAEQVKDEAQPTKYQLKLDEEIVLKGKFELWNGWPPNLRFATKDNLILGIGRNEQESEMPKEFKSIEELSKYEVEVRLRYIGEVNIPYYDVPLQCFKVVKILKMVPIE
jgi:hypothetical protein